MNAASVLFQLSSYELLLTLVTKGNMIIPGRWRPCSPMTRLLLYHLELLYKGNLTLRYFASNVHSIGDPQLARIKHLDLLDKSTQSINMPTFVVKIMIVHYSCFKIFSFFFLLFSMTMRWQLRKMVILIMYITILWNHVTLLHHKVWNFIQNATIR